MRALEPLPKSMLSVKSEPVSYIKKENGFGMEHHSDYDHEVSLMSSSSSSSPGSPPNAAVAAHLFRNAAAAAAAAAGSSHPMGHPDHGPGPSQHNGGGKMRSMPSPGGIPMRKKPGPVTQEEEELTNVPSLQMRIRILQNRVSFRGWHSYGHMF